MQQNLHTVSRSINSQAAQIRNSLSEIEKSLNKIASNEDIKNKKPQFLLLHCGFLLVEIWGFEPQTF